MTHSLYVLSARLIAWAYESIAETQTPPPPIQAPCKHLQTQAASSVERKSHACCLVVEPLGALLPFVSSVTLAGLEVFILLSQPPKRLGSKASVTGLAQLGSLRKETVT